MHLRICTQYWVRCAMCSYITSKLKVFFLSGQLFVLCGPFGHFPSFLALLLPLRVVFVTHCLSTCRDSVSGTPVKTTRVGSHKLSLSRLRPSMLRTLLTTPSLKNFSSPAALRPPMYHGPPTGLTSRNPSLELSLPRRLPAPGMGTALRVPALAADEWRATWAVTLAVCRWG